MIESVSNLSRGEGNSFVCLTADPQIYIKPSEIPSGRWIVFDFVVVTEQPVVSRFCVYPDFGSGYSETTAIRLSYRRSRIFGILRFDRPLKGLRIDPMEEAQAFRVEKMSLKGTNSARALVYLIGESFRKVFG